ncbi:MAG: helix-turn-helix domain-containing protein [Butyricimonas virosa]|uniref:helix-turn-helix domain-containing protein n=1 Tax=Butyricimonas virosa TaxID=544645 RepID=UPI002432A1B1|nr:helix-turn-helix transcriptional regulator [Butyricimonas virosa]MCI7161767.1 helix-turn-helix domain-containing protein [Butyricimonas virosa]
MMKTTLDIYIIEKVKQIREEKGFTREQVDIKLGFSPGANYISHIENDTTNSYNLYHLNELAKILDCDIADFFPRPYQEANSLQEYRNAKEEAKRKAKEKREKEKK